MYFVIFKPHYDNKDKEAKPQGNLRFSLNESMFYHEDEIITMFYPTCLKDVHKISNHISTG